MHLAVFSGGGNKPVWRLDAGDSSSYSSGQTWSNLVIAPTYTGASQTDYDFYLGATSGSESSDPTHNGTPGNKSSSEYFNPASGEFFTIAAGNDGFINSLHKNSAKFTLMFALKTKTTFSTLRLPLFSTIADADGDSTTSAIDADLIGISFFIYNRRLQFQVGNGSGTRALVVSGDATTDLSANTTHIIGMSVDEAAGIVRFYNNQSTVEYSSAPYSSPSSSAATYSAHICSEGDEGVTSENSAYLEKLFQCAAYSKAFNSADFNRWYNQYSSRYL